MLFMGLYGCAVGFLCRLTPRMSREQRRFAVESGAQRARTRFACYVLHPLLIPVINGDLCAAFDGRRLKNPSFGVRKRALIQF